MADNVVRAERFEIVDHQGNLRASLGLTPNGSVALTLRDPAGTIRVEVGLEDGNTPVVNLYDKDERTRMVFRESRGGGHAITATDQEGTPRFLLAVNSRGTPQLTLFNGNGDVIWDPT